MVTKTYLKHTYLCDSSDSRDSIDSSDSSDSSARSDSKTNFSTQFKKSNCERKKKMLKMSKTQIVRKLKLSNYDKTHLLKL